MQWLVHGNLSEAVEKALVKREDKVHRVDELALPDPTNLGEVLKAAHAKQWDIITKDPALAAAPFEMNLRFDRSIVFLQLTGGEVEEDDAVDRLFERYRRLTPKRLYTVTETRVKIRQLPTTMGRVRGQSVAPDEEE